MSRSGPASRASSGATVTVAVLACLVVPARGVEAQGVVVDEGTFAISLNGRAAGTEEFTIRRAGLGSEEVVFASATVELRRDGESQQVRSLLRATPLEGLPKCEGAEPCYQVDVEGADAMSLRLGLSGRRYVARIVDAVGEEIREFPAAPGTRILELDVAHLYYFLRDVREGTATPVLVPRDRSRAMLTPGSPTDEEIQLGPTLVQARRVDFTSGDDRRTVWFDRLGRVLRVAIPRLGYLAERTDLVG
jgi:hypothetical protein